jgi:putative PIN family toxin of toxin-antitoxin system
MALKNDRLVIDTNLWISFLLNKRLSALDQLFYNSQIELLFSDELITEFIDVAHRPKFRKYFSKNDLEELILRIRMHAEFVNVITKVNICRDPKDNFLLSLAKDGKASHLITGDADLLVLKSFDRIKILTFSEYIK